MFLAIVTCVLLYTSVYVILGLIFVLLSPAAKPVTESLANVKKCNFLERLRKSVIVFADGAKAWKTESRRLRLTFRNVVHYKMEFCRKTKVKKKVKISGTQKFGSNVETVEALHSIQCGHEGSLYKKGFKAIRKLRVELRLEIQ